MVSKRSQTGRTSDQQRGGHRHKGTEWDREQSLRSRIHVGERRKALQGHKALEIGLMHVNLIL